METILKIAVGVFIGALAAAFTWEGVQTVRVEIALKQASDKMKQTATEINARNRANQIAEQTEHDRNAKEQQQRQQQAEEARQLQSLRDDDKKAAFNRFFQPTPECQRDSAQAVCANAYIKAQTTFEKQYKPTR